MQISTLRRPWFLPLAIAAIALTIVALGSATPARSAPVDESVAANHMVFRNAMGKLWEDHITWTRLFIVSFAADLPDQEPTAARLLQNQVDIGNAIKPFYGDAAGDQLTGLLKEHILIAVDVLKAAKAGDAAGLDNAQTRWVTNADEIGMFLSSANPENWSEDDMKAMMREHLELTTQEAVARLNKDWAADIAAYDKVHLQILEMADMLAWGIIAQFPHMFE